MVLSWFRIGVLALRLVHKFDSTFARVRVLASGRVRALGVVLVMWRLCV